MKRQKAAGRSLIHQITMSGNKRAAPEEFTNNIDAMKCLIMAMSRDNKAEAESNKRLKVEVEDLKESNHYLHRQVDRLDGYTQELEARLDTLNAVVENMLNRGRVERDATQDIVANLRETRQYDMTDVDRLLFETDTDEDEDDAFDAELAAIFGEDDPTFDF